MKTHIATGEEFGTITAELVDGSKPLVLVGLGAVQLITNSEDDADQLIRAGELAKELHRQARAHGEPYVSPYGASADEVARDAEPYQLPQQGSDDEMCPATIGNLICTLDRGHTGRHEAHGASPLPVWDDGDTEFGRAQDDDDAEPYPAQPGKCEHCGVPDDQPGHHFGCPNSPVDNPDLAAEPDDKTRPEDWDMWGRPRVRDDAPASPLAPPAPYTTGDLTVPAEDDAR